jgi:hypothetical protein
MTFFSSDPLFDFTIYALQVCSSILPTYELHINLSSRKKKATTNYALVRIQKYHIQRDLRVSYKGISEFYLKTYKTSRMMVKKKSMRHSA